MCFINIPIINCTNEAAHILAEVITIDLVLNPADVVDWDSLAQLANHKKKLNWVLTKQIVPQNDTWRNSVFE